MCGDSAAATIHVRRVSSSPVTGSSPGRTPCSDSQTRFILEQPSPTATLYYTRVLPHHRNVFRTFGPLRMRMVFRDCHARGRVRQHGVRRGPVAGRATGSATRPPVHPAHPGLPSPHGAYAPALCDRRTTYAPPTSPSDTQPPARCDRRTFSARLGSPYDAPTPTSCIKKTI